MRAVILAFPAVFRRCVRRGAGEFLPQLRAGQDEAGAGQMQTHHLHHHLVGIGSAVKSAGAGTMITRALGLQQFGAADFPFGEQLADARFFLVGETRGHRPTGNEDRRQMAVAQSADQQPQRRQREGGEPEMQDERDRYRRGQEEFGGVDRADRCSRPAPRAVRA